MPPDARPGQAYSEQLFPTRLPSFLVVLAVLVVAGVLGAGTYEAQAADVLTWFVVAALMVALGRLIWRRTRRFSDRKEPS